ncbi:restriction endonuclease subunit S [Glutamicibacter protophormiae]|uniref:Type I restriction enzyme S subunit n=1 Tax=Glutamicibacter protophormiae TaxID=37930 RepID=A0ABS4XLB2_GLUPR|nr:restriction endonuclease subunit S [Glutamicibacter protophormiae]MBP2397296.1 type I restriction enzyme S subunit [Glutamicibacter protophormiae]GGL80309.1 type I restriction-modification system subunit S [Glutamicibacter protophormiae]
MIRNCQKLLIADAPLQLIDGDRGKHYPNGTDFTTNGDCLFLSARNVTKSGFLFEETSFISGAKDSILRAGKLKRGDIVLTTRGTVGNCALYDETVPYDNIRINSGMLLVRADSRFLDARYLYYFLRSEFFGAQVESLVSGSAQPQLPVRDLNTAKIFMPTITKQRAIADVLGALDDKIAFNTKFANNIDTYIHLQFEAAIQGSVSKVKPFLEVFDVQFGEAFKGDKFAEPGTGRPLIRIRDLKTFTSQVWTTESRSKETLVHAGDVVVGMDAEFRATSWLGEPGLLNQRVCRVTSKLGKSAFVRESLKRPLATIENYKTGTTVIHLNKKDLEENNVLIPDIEAINYFESTTEDLYRSRVALAAENRALAATRDALLPQLMSGKLQLKDAETLVGSVV